jgi:1-pyrroline-4-hydroxy-2-carboxylate deaminase
VALCEKAAKGHTKARMLELALGLLSSFDEGTDRVLYYKHLMVLAGSPE